MDELPLRDLDVERPLTVEKLDDWREWCTAEFGGAPVEARLVSDDADEIALVDAWAAKYGITTVRHV